MSTIIGVPLLKPRELNQGGTSTSETVFTSDGTQPIVLRLPACEQLCSANGRGARRIMVRAGGRLTGGTTTNFTPQLQFGTSATSTSNTDIESGSAVAVNSTSGLWFVEADLVITTGNFLDGFSRFAVIGSTRTATDWAVIDNAITTADPDATTAMGFVVTGTFSGGSASNAAYLDWFTLSVLD